jgi:hypothetical protein
VSLPLNLSTPLVITPLSGGLFFHDRDHLLVLTLLLETNYSGVVGERGCSAAHSVHAC